jgi:RHS repeat-associated protein
MRAHISTGYRSFLGKFHDLSRHRHRIVATLLLVIFLVSIITPSASIYAESRQPKINSQIIDQHRNKLPDDIDKPMKQNYPGSIKESASTFKAANDSALAPVARDVKQQALPSFEETLKQSQKPIDPTKKQELVEDRAANKEVFRNSDGSLTERQYLGSKYYKSEGAWQAIDSSIKEDKNAVDSSNVFGQVFGEVQSWAKDQTTFKTAKNSWQARFAPSNDKVGMVRVQQNGQTVSFSPQGAKNVAPVITTDKDGRQVVNYYDLWNGVDVEYIVTADLVKENIIIKNKSATTDFNFTVKGASLKPDQDVEGAFKLEGALGNEFSITPVVLFLNNFGPEAKPVLTQKAAGDTLKISADKNYINNLPNEAFPAVIDPGVHHGTMGNRQGGDYKSFKSDGYVCPAQTCNPYAGTVLDVGGVWRNWRGAFYANYTALQNYIPPSQPTELRYANLHLQQRLGLSTSGTTATKWIDAWQNTCSAYSCLGEWGGEVYMGTTGDINLTNLYRNRIAANDWGAWIMLTGEENAGTTTYKNFDPDPTSGTYVDFTYNYRPAVPVPQVPSTDPNTEAVITTIQPLMGVSSTSDPDGDPVKYSYQLRSTNGVVLYQTDWVDANRLTVPEGLLQDGGSYAWSFAIWDGYWNSGWQNGGKFRVDLRTGKDKTSTYKEVGPVSVSLNNGNVYTSVESHNIKALDGNIGLSLDYNSPLASRQGILAEYFNNTTFSGEPVLRRTEATVDNVWSNGSPAQNVVNVDNFSSRYTGYFVAPVSGDYYFGANNDDQTTIKVNNQQTYNNAGCSPGPCYGSVITLSAGQTVPIEVKHVEGGGAATARVFVKGAVTETIVKTEWLRTAPMPTEQNTGLTGYYYADDGSHNPAQLTKIMTRQDPSLNFQWGTLAPIPNVQADNLYVKWEGYFTPPTTGNYTFGTKADDGTRVKINGNTIMQNWTGGTFSLIYGPSGVFLTAGVSVPITVEYFELTGGAYMQLYAKGPNNPSGGVVEAQYLKPGGKVLPAGWSISADTDGNLAYERLEIRQNGDVIMYDADGSTHLFTNTGTGFKPPVDEDAFLTRNADGTHTLTDTDGRVYVFNVDGTLRETQTPYDDRNPAAIKYNYATQNGIPKLSEIVDGVTNTRKGNLYYAGASQCAAPPATFNAAPTDNLCTFITTDGQRTDFFYRNSQLARVQLPGNTIYDFGYDQTNGMLTNIRDVLANDAVAAGIRADDATVNTEITYDSLARATSVTAPAPTTGANRSVYTLDYLPSKSKLHVSGAAEPNGYSQYIEYDDLLRTTKACDVAALCDQSEWHTTKDLSLSTTDEAGLKSTTIYDADDLPTDTYGPAPTTWFGVDRKALPAYVNQVPHTETKYDEAIVGLVVAYYNFKAANKAFIGAPKLHSTGFNANPQLTTQSWGSNSPITPDAGMDGWGLSATGKLAVPNAGSHTFRIWHDDGARLWVNDQLIIDDWTTGSNRSKDGTVTLEANKPIRIKLDYFDVDKANANLDLSMHFNGTPVTGDNNFGTMLKPGYNLTTSTKVFDSQTGDVTNTTNYGNRPELSQIISTTEDVGGQNLTTNFAYEPYQTGSLMRQTSKTLPSGNTFTYSHYGATETRVNPCIAGSPAVSQGGLPKSKTEPDPDGAGPQTARTTETVYDAAGRVVASRYNNEAWTCIVYDVRGRTYTTSVPARGTYQPARTITNRYALSGNPFISTTSDSQGAITVETDLSGRTIRYVDINGDQTTSTYDDLDRLVSRSGPLGEEEFVYDQYNRLVDQKLDSTTYAHVAYDAYGRIDNVAYPAAGQQKVTYARDTLNRLNGLTYNGITTITSTSGSNLIANPSLETANSGDPNTPDKWHSSEWGAIAPSFTYENTGHTGSRSVKTEATNYEQGDAKWYFEPVPVSGNATYEFSDYYRSNIPSKIVVEYTHTDNSQTYQQIAAPATSSTWTSTGTISFTAPSTAVTATVFHLIETVGWLAIDDADMHEITRVPGATGTIASDNVTRSTTGDILSGTENSLSKNYTYDNAGRLTAATIGSNTYNYSYVAPSATTCNQASANLNAHKNGNRTSMTINGNTTTYCYDYADRLISSSDTSVSNPIYDDHGNVIQMGPTNNPLRFPVDASDRNRGVEQYDDNGNGSAVYYFRDVQGRVQVRCKNTITNWDWIDAGCFYHGYTASGDSPDFVRDSNWNITEKYLSLPGNVLLTIRPSEPDTAKQNTYSLPNIHGDVFATTNTNGVLTSVHATGPFGEAVTGQTNPNNTVLGATYNYVGQHQKLTETEFSVQFTQMGARVYVPSIGRFLQVDQVEGGTDNSYVYVSDPVNDFDLDGTFGFKKFFGNVAKVASVASFIPGPVGMIAAGVATVCYAGTGNYAAAAASAVGLIPGGKLVGTLASRSAVGSKALSKVIDFQAKTKGIGTRSKLFGHTQMGAGKQGLLNGRFTNKIKVGWSNNLAGQREFRIGLGTKDFVSRSGRLLKVSRFHINNVRFGK